MVVSGGAVAVLSIVRSGLPKAPAVLPEADSVLSVGLQVQSCGGSVVVDSVSVVLDSVSAGSGGRETSIAICEAAVICVAVDSDTASVDACKPSAGSGMPVPHASNVEVGPVAADNWDWYAINSG